MDRGNTCRGWTMVEIMVVILVIGVVTAISIPALTKARKDARIQQAQGHVEMLAAAIKNLAWDTGKWPGGVARNVQQDAELWDLTASISGLREEHTYFTGWQGPYIHQIELDPWGNPYFFDPDYRVNGVYRVVVGSFGPNERGRNVYDDDNIYIFLDD